MFENLFALANLKILVLVDALGDLMCHLELVLFESIFLDLTSSFLNEMSLHDWLGLKGYIFLSVSWTPEDIWSL